MFQEIPGWAPEKWSRKESCENSCGTCLVAQRRANRVNRRKGKNPLAFWNWALSLWSSNIFSDQCQSWRLGLSGLLCYYLIYYLSSLIIIILSISVPFDHTAGRLVGQSRAWQSPGRAFARTGPLGLCPLPVLPGMSSEPWNPTWGLAWKMYYRFKSLILGFMG